MGYSDRGGPPYIYTVSNCPSSCPLLPAPRPPLPLPRTPRHLSVSGIADPVTAADVDRILLATPGVVRLTIMKPRKRSRRSKRGQKNDVYEDDTPLIAVEYDPAMVGPRDIIEVLEAAPAVGAGKSNAPPDCW